MANINAPFGLQPVQYLNGNMWNGQVRIYVIPSGDGNAYAPGDPVATSSGNADTYGISAITLATAGSGNPIRGVAIAFGTGPVGSTATAGPFPGGPYVNPSNLASVIVPATKTSNWYAAVVDDPEVLFEIQEATPSGPLAMSVIGKNAVLVSGTNNGYVSGWQLSAATAPAVTAAYQLRIMQLIQRPDVTPVSANQKWLVKINTHELGAGATGVAGN